MKSLKFQASEIRDNGPLHVSEQIDPEVFTDCLGEAGSLVSPIGVELDVCACEGDFEIDGWITGLWELECRRCLAHPRTSYNARLKGLVEARGGFLDTIEEIRQTLTLAAPAWSFCQPDCKGLCLCCGQSKNGGGCSCGPATAVY